MTESYCVRCKTNRVISVPLETRIDRYNVVVGKCQVCGNPLYHFPKQLPEIIISLSKSAMGD